MGRLHRLEGDTSQSYGPLTNISVQQEILEGKKVSFRNGKIGENRRLRQKMPNGYEVGSDLGNSEVIGKS